MMVLAGLGIRSSSRVTIDSSGITDLEDKLSPRAVEDVLWADKDWLRDKSDMHLEYWMFVQ